MTIAVGTLLLFLLIIPGIAYKKAFSFGPQTKNFHKFSAFDDFIWGIIPGMVFQALGTMYIGWQHPWGYFINLEQLGSIMLNSDVSQLSGIQKNLDAIFLYNVALISVAAMVGGFLRLTIRYFNLDHHFSTLRFNNEWYYILKGETMFFKEAKKLPGKKYYSLIEVAQCFGIPKLKMRKVSIRLLGKERKFKRPTVDNFFRRNQSDLGTCTVHSVVKGEDGKLQIYTGIIDRFYLARDGSLETVLIKGARRKPFDNKPGNYYKIPSINVLVLRGKEIVDIGVNSIPDISPTRFDGFETPSAVKELPLPESVAREIEEYSAWPYRKKRTSYAPQTVSIDFRSSINSKNKRRFQRVEQIYPRIRAALHQALINTIVLQQLKPNSSVIVKCPTVSRRYLRDGESIDFLVFIIEQAEPHECHLKLTEVNSRNRRGY